MTRLEQNLQALTTARNAQAAVDAHLERERARADLEGRCHHAQAVYLEAAGRVTCGRQGCACAQHRALRTALEAYRAAWLDWRGA